MGFDMMISSKYWQLPTAISNPYGVETVMKKKLSKKCKLCNP